MKYELKQQLIQLRANEYKIESEKVDRLLLKMMDHIGTTDAELRDDLIYLTFCNWTVNNVLLEETLIELLNISTDSKHLFYKIGEKNTDSVFTRSFSMLLIVLIIYKHREENFLSNEQITMVYKKIIKYCTEEKDFRGYVEKKGWAHAIAHAGDALDELSKCSELKKSELLRILDVIKEKICIYNYVYVHREEERLVTAVMSIMERNLLTEIELYRWINSFGRYKKKGYLPQDDYILVNIKNFLRSLYFRLKKNNPNNNLVEEIEKVLCQISIFL